MAKGGAAACHDACHEMLAASDPRGGNALKARPDGMLAASDRRGGSALEARPNGADGGERVERFAHPRRAQAPRGRRLA